MTTGTEGNDNLINNPNVNPETVSGLGGDDVIQAQRPNHYMFSEALVAVDGGAGFDRLITGGLITGATSTGPGGSIFFTFSGDGRAIDWEVSYVNIERLTMSGHQLALTGSNRLDFGDEEDFLDLSPASHRSGMDLELHTGGGNDEVRLTGAFGNVILDTGAGDDYIRLFDFTTGTVSAAGGAGNDIYEFGNNVTVTENADEGIDEVRTFIAAYTLPANVENLVGTAGNQTLTGNDLDNVIVVGSGTNSLSGLGGDDILAGGIGHDTFDGGDGSDTLDYSRYANDGNIIVNLSAGNVPSSGRAGLGPFVGANTAVDGFGNQESLTSIENVRTRDGQDFIYGSEGANRIETGGANDYIEGRGGDDHIDGGTGGDHMIGGFGNDVYVVDHAGDLVVEDAGQGTDEVRTALAAYTLTAAHVENLTGTSDAGQSLTGSSGDNRISGGAGDDVLDGAGGTDTLVGGLGDDAYIVDGAEDVIVENPGEGTDEVRTALAAYTLTAATVENLTGTSDAGQSLTGNDEANVISGGAGDDVLTGNAGDDTLLGNGGDDILIGLAGTDTLVGGNGNDIYAIDAADILVEQFDGGTDEVRTVSTIFTLQDNFENLRGLNDGGHLFRGNLGPNGLIGANGNDLILAQDGGDDVVYTLGGNDQIYFRGAFTADDWAHGGDGSDSLILQGNYSGGVLLGNAPQGNISGIETILLLSAGDTTYGGQFGGTAAYDLTSKDGNVAPGTTLVVDGRGLQAGESLSFDGSAETDGRFELLGGAAEDVLTGGAGNDLFDGGGAADTLSGNGGADTFRYEEVGDSTAGAFDTINGFAHAIDRIDLAAIDANASTPENDAFAFIGSAAFSAAGQLRASNVSGDLWRVEGDVDGDGNADLVIQVIMEAGQPLDAGDFVL